MRLIIAGGRDVTASVETLDGILASAPLITSPLIEIICGMAQGADLAGRAWARARGVPVHEEPVTPADFAEHGRYKAAKVRNWRMAKRGDAALVLWDGYSGGSAHMVACMVALSKLVRVVRAVRP